MKEKYGLAPSEHIVDLLYEALMFEKGAKELEKSIKKKKKIK